MTTILDTSGLDKRLQQIKSVKNLDARPLMQTWTEIIREDNRRGVLAGLDKDGVPMAGVTYRPKPETHLGKPHSATLRVGQKVTGKGAKSIRETLAQFRRGQRASKKAGSFGGVGAMEAGINNNLSTAEYQLLGGPPLAPRDQFSRVITNLVPQRPMIPSAGVPYWEAVCAWDEVVDKKGRPFLRYHFEGIGQKRRDLRGVRPAGVQKALEALRNWARTVIHEHFGR